MQNVKKIVPDNVTLHMSELKDIQLADDDKSSIYCMTFIFKDNKNPPISMIFSIKKFRDQTYDMLLVPETQKRKQSKLAIISDWVISNCASFFITFYFIIGIFSLFII